MTDKSKKILIISGVITCLICIIMALFVVPSINDYAIPGQKIFDKRPLGYSLDDAKFYSYGLTQEGKDIYLTKYMPLDFIHLIAYVVFFVYAIATLFQKKKFLKIIPILMGIFDTIENVIIIFMIKIYASELMVQISSWCTTLKYVVLLATLIIIIIGYNKKRKNKQPKQQRKI